MSFAGMRKGSFPGIKLMGGAGENTTTIIIFVVLIGIIVYLVYTGYIGNPLNWFKKTDE